MFGQRLPKLDHITDFDMEILDEREISDPQQCDQIILVGRRTPCPLQDGQQSLKFGRFKARLQRQRSQSVAMQQPGQSFRPTLQILIDDARVPEQRRIAHIELDGGRVLPHGHEGGACLLECVRSSRTVRQIELDRPLRFGKRTERVLDRGGRDV